MARNFNFNAVLKLQSSQFNKGIKEVQKSLKALGNTFKNLTFMMVGGLGFSKLTDNLKRTAAGLSNAKAVLKNVSTEMKANGIQVDHYGENLSWLRDLAEKYNQEQIGLINTFAQFTAAAKTCNISLDDQKTIFEALTRAAAGYHMSADNANQMMYAVTQMMSKGKVVAEELRRQLGNTLPGAFGLMAQALGVTNAELEEMMSKGEVLAQDALPKFAKVLNQITANMSFESLQNSLNKFKNEWTNFVESVNFERFYKGMVDAGTNGLRWISNNFNEILAQAKGFAVALGSLLGSVNLIGGGKTIIGKYNDAVKRDFNALLSSQNKIESQYKNLGGKLESVFSDKGKWFDFKSLEKSGFGLDEKDIKKMISYNKSILEAEKNARKLGIALLSNKGYDNLNKGTKALETFLMTQRASEGKFTELDLKVNKFARFSVKAGDAIAGIVKSANFWLAVLSVIAGVVTTIVTRYKQVKKEQEEINNLCKNYEEALYQAQHSESQELTELLQHRKTLQDQNKSLAEKKVALKRINEIMGREGKYAFDIKKSFDSTGNLINDKIIPAMDKWVEKMRKISELQFRFNTVNEKTAENIKLEQEYQRKVDAFNKDKKYNFQKAEWYFDSNGNIDESKFNNTSNQWANIKGAYTKQGAQIMEMANLRKRIEENKKVIEDAEGEISNLTTEIDGLNTTLTTGGGGGGGSETNLKGTLKGRLIDYLDEVKKLDNQFENGAVTLDEYRQEFEKLSESAYKDASAFDDLEQQLSKLNPTLRDAFDTAKRTTNQAKETAEWNKKNQAAVDRQNAWNGLNLNPSRKGRDTFFDYSKTDADILGEMADNADDYRDALKDLVKEIEDFQKEHGALDEQMQAAFDEILDKLDKAGNEAQTLRQKANIAQWKADVKELRKEVDAANLDKLRESLNGIQGLVSTMEGLKDAWETLSDDDSTFLDKLKAVVSSLSDMLGIYETLISIQEAYNNAKEASIALQKAEAAVQSDATLAALANAEANQMSANAEAKEAVAAAASSGAKMPFPYNLIAIAAGVGAVVAALSSLQKFANGGIVGGGSKSGDKTLIRANAGEVVLNAAQQRNLAGKLNMGGNVKFEIQGDRLVGVLRNYNKQVGGGH